MLDIFELTIRKSPFSPPSDVRRSHFDLECGKADQWWQAVEYLTDQSQVWLSARLRKSLPQFVVSYHHIAMMSWSTTRRDRWQEVMINKVEAVSPSAVRYFLAETVLTFTRT